VSDIQLAAGIKVVTHGKPNPVIVLSAGNDGSGIERVFELQICRHLRRVCPREAKNFANRII